MAKLQQRISPLRIDHITKEASSTARSLAATVLNSPRAVEMSLYVVRAFVQLRELLASNTELARKLNELERKLQGHDEAITAILSAIRELMKPQTPQRRGIGFTANLEETR